MLAPVAPANTEQLGRSMIGITAQAVHGSFATNLPGKALTYIQILQELSLSIYRVLLSIQLSRLVYTGYHVIFTHDTQRMLCCCSPILLGWYQRQQKKSILPTIWWATVSAEEEERLSQLPRCPNLKAPAPQQPECILRYTWSPGQCAERPAHNREEVIMGTRGLKEEKKNCKRVQKGSAAPWAVCPQVVT